MHRHIQVYSCIFINTHTRMHTYIYIYIYNLNLEGIQYDIIDTSSFMLHAIFSQYFLP